MAELFQVEIILPERTFYSGDATMIEFTSVNGELGVYPRHIPLTTVVSPGVVKIHEESGIRSAAVHDGFAEILPDKVTIMAETAEWPEEIDVKRAQEAKARAEELLKRRDEKVDMDRAELALKRALARMSLTEQKF